MILCHLPVGDNCRVDGWGNGLPTRGNLDGSIFQDFVNSIRGLDSTNIIIYLLIVVQNFCIELVLSVIVYSNITFYCLSHLVANLSDYSEFKFLGTCLIINFIHLINH